MVIITIMEITEAKEQESMLAITDLHAKHMRMSMTERAIIIY